MKNRLFLFIASLFFLTYGARALPPEDLYMTGTQMSDLVSYTTGGHWSFLNPTVNFPEGAYYVVFNRAATTTTPGKVRLKNPDGTPRTLAPGTYYVFLRAQSANTSISQPYATCAVKLAGVTKTVDLDDRDVGTKLWTIRAPFTTTTPATEIDLDVSISDTYFPPSNNFTTIMSSIYITPNPNVIVTGQSEVQNVTLPTVPDTSPAVKGNHVYNSSFELGVSSGWGAWMTADREFSIVDSISTAEHHSGAQSLKMDMINNASMSRWFLSIPIPTTPNKNYTLSAWVKSDISTTRNVKLRWVNTGYVAPGQGFDPAYYQENSMAIDNSQWRRISVVMNPMWAYPETIGNIQLYYDGQTTGGTIYWDDIQLEEGSATTYAPKHPVEFALNSTVPGKIFYSNETLEMQLRINNLTANNTNVTFFWNVFDSDNRMVDQRVVQNVNALANTLTTSPFSIAVGSPTKLGIFRGRLYTTNYACETEYVYSIVPPSVLPVNNFLTNGVLGTHPNFTTWQLPIARRIGSTHARCLSPEADMRWNIVEDSNDHWIYHDAEIDLALANFQIVQGLLGENSAGFDQRNFIPFSSVSGAPFAIGDAVTWPGGGGTVTVALNPTSHATGWAIQTSPSGGTMPAVNDVITGPGGKTGIAKKAFAKTGLGGCPGTPDFIEWEKFVTAMVTHYRTTRVKLWEIWNEPNQDDEIAKASSSSDDLGFYAEMARRAIIKITAADSECQIVLMGGVFTVAYMQEVTAKLDSLMGPTWKDRVVAFAAHLYDDNSSAMAGFKSPIVDVYGRPVWNTETGNLGGRSFYTGAGAYQPRDSMFIQEWQDTDVWVRGHRYFPEWLARNMMESLGGAGGRSKWFQYDMRASVRPDAPDGLLLTGTLIDYNDTVRANAAQMAFGERMIEGGYGLGKVQNPSSSLVSYAFTNNDSGFVAAWTFDSSLQNLNISGTLSAAQYSVLDWMGNPVTVTANLIPLSRQLHYIKAAAGVNWQTISNAVQAGVITARADTQPPNVSIALGPDGKVRFGKPVYMRCFALDEKDMPDIAKGNVVQFATKMEPEETAFAAWTGSGLRKYLSMASGVHTFSVKAKDSAGNESAVVQRKIVILNADGSDPEGGGGPGPGGNTAPTLTAISPQTVAELATLYVPLAATDADVPAQTLTFSVDPPGLAGLTVANGFTPLTRANNNAIVIDTAHATKPLIYPDTITVNPGELPGLITKVTVTLNGFTHTYPDDITVVLQGPTGAANWLFGKVGGSLDVNNVTLTFDDASAISLPQSAQIVSGTYKPTKYTGNGNPPAPSPKPPEPFPSTDSPLSIYNNTDATGPWKLFFTDVGPDDYGSISGWSLTIVSGGNSFTFTPSELQGPGTFTPTIRVTDSGSPAMSASQVVTITVTEVNRAPTLGTIATPQAVTVGQNLRITTTVTDPDLPAQSFTYSLAAGSPSGATINSLGVFNWTPEPAQVGNFSITAIATDSGSPPLTSSQTFQVNVAAAPVVVGSTVWVKDLDSELHCGDNFLGGTGTQLDPFWGDFDRIKRERVADNTMNLSGAVVGGVAFVGGEFYSRGIVSWEQTVATANMKKGETITGSGINATRIHFKPASLPNAPCQMFMGAFGVTNITITGLTVDMEAWPAGTDQTFYTAKRNGIFLSGNNCSLRQVRVTNCFGFYQSGESFPLSINEGTNNIIEQCEVTMSRGNYGSAINFRSGICRNNKVFFDPLAPRMTHQFFGLNFAGSTNTSAYGNIVFNGMNGCYYDTLVAKNLLITQNTFSNVLTGMFVNLYTRADNEDLEPIRGLDGMTFSQNIVYHNPLDSYAHSVNISHLTLNPPNNCGHLIKNFARHIVIRDNNVGFAAGITPPSAAAMSIRRVVKLGSDVLYTENGPYPVGIDDVQINNNIAQPQNPPEVNFVYENYVSTCSTDGNALATRVFVDGQPLPPPLVGIVNAAAVGAPLAPLAPLHLFFMFP